MHVEHNTDGFVHYDYCIVGARGSFIYAIISLDSGI